MVQYAIMWHIMLTTQSGAMVTVVTLVGFLPMFVISPFGGVWADRFNRKRLIVISDAAIAIVSLLVAILLMAGYTHLGLLLVCAAVRALGQGIQMPAVGAVIPQIIPVEELTRVNGIYGSVQSFCGLAAPMAGAALMSFTPLATLFFLDVITAGIGICIFIFFVKVPSLNKSEEVPVKTGYFHELLEGLRYIRKQGFVFRLLIFQGIFLIFVCPASLLTPLQVVRNFGDDVWRLSVMEVAFSLGMILGGLLIAAWGGFKNRIYTMALACLLFGIATIGLGITPFFWIYIGIMAFIGIVMPVFNTPSMVLLQSNVKPEFMGRVMSVFMMEEVPF